MTPAGFVAGSRVPRASAVLSRFACLRREQRRWILESPLSTVRIELTDPAGVRLIGALGLPGSAAHRAREAGVSPGTVRAVLALLDTAGFLTTAEGADPSLAQWEFADLLLHARSRLGTHDQPIGARFGFRHRIAPLPALKRSTRPRAATIPLPRPEPERLARTDSPFAAVLEARRSTRKFSGTPLSMDELGEFLFRSARVRRVYPAGARQTYETTSRPYPSGGACYPLEIYLVARRCFGLAAGLYHYDPAGHALTPILRSQAAARRLMADAVGAVGAVGEQRAPQALLILSARFARVAWKYRSIAYATVLKDVGVLLQTMYLVAEAMGLASCAAGCGDAALLARTIGSRLYEESSVGEFLLGRTT
jgi:SagB-type dehydrogenase family enzyme